MDINETIEITKHAEGVYELSVTYEGHTRGRHLDCRYDQRDEATILTENICELYDKIKFFDMDRPAAESKEDRISRLWADIDPVLPTLDDSLTQEERWLIRQGCWGDPEEEKE